MAISQLARPGALFEIEAIAVLPAKAAAKPSKAKSPSASPKRRNGEAGGVDLMRARKALAHKPNFLPLHTGGRGDHAHYHRTVVPSSSIRNAYIDFSQMTASVVAIFTDAVRDGRPVVGFGFNSNGRYAPQGLLRERFIPRLKAAKPEEIVDARGLIDPAKAWDVMMRNEKPGGHGERSVAVGVLDMALWDAVAKAEGVPLWRLLADRYNGGQGRQDRLGLCRRRLLLSRQGHRRACRTR